MCTVFIFQNSSFSNKILGYKFSGPGQTDYQTCHSIFHKDKLEKNTVPNDNLLVSGQWNVLVL